MGTFHLTIDVNRPTADVFAFVAEPRNMPLWYEAVEHVDEMTPKTPSHAASVSHNTVASRSPRRQHRRSLRVDEATPHGDVRKPRRPDTVSLSLHNRTQRRRKPAHPRRGDLERRTPRTARSSRRHRNPSLQARHATEPRGTEASRRIGCHVTVVAMWEAQHEPSKRIRHRAAPTPRRQRNVGRPGSPASATSSHGSPDC